MTLVKMGTYQGTDILYDPETEMVSLTAMWKAAGEGNRYRNPTEWSRKEGKAVIASISRELNTPEKRILETRRGKGGGTWAHRRIALAYGAYLNPDLHALILRWAEERMEEEANPDLAYQRGRERAVEGYKRRGWSEERIAQRLQGIDTRKAFTDKLQQHGVEGRAIGSVPTRFMTAFWAGRRRNYASSGNCPKRQTSARAWVWMNCQQSISRRWSQGSDWSASRRRGTASASRFVSRQAAMWERPLKSYWKENERDGNVTTTDPQEHDGHRYHGEAGRQRRTVLLLFPWGAAETPPQSEPGL